MMGLGAGAGKRGELGASLVEFAIVAPLLFLLLFGIIESGRLLATYTSVYTAAREGARYATVTAGSTGVPAYVDCAGIEAAARAKAPFLSGSEVEIEVIWPDSGGACPTPPAPEAVDRQDRVKVVVRSEFSSPVPIISALLGNITVESSQQRTVFVPEDDDE